MKNIACFALFCCMMACGNEELSSELTKVDNFAWSEPVWLGPVINSTARDWQPVPSTDGLRLYFHSDREGGFDIWMSRRDGPNCPWQTPVKLGAPISTDEYDEGDVEFTSDGHTLFFLRDAAPDGEGMGDIYRSRVDVNAWAKRRSG